MYQILALLHAGETSVRDQVHIRNAEAAQLARTLARQTGKTISEVVLDALRQYRPQPRPRDGIVSSFGDSFCAAIAPA
jgi:Rv0623-like transcription factor